MQENFSSILFISFIFILCYGIPIRVERKNRLSDYDENKYGSVVLNEDNDGIGGIEFEEDDGVSHDVDDKGWLKKVINHLKDYEENEDFPSNGELFEEDIIMDDRLREAVFAQKSKKSSIKEDLLYLMWPNGVIYYEIEKSFAPRNKELLKEAFEQFENRTCIRFKNRTVETAYVVFSSKKNICASRIGRSGKRQVVNLGKNCGVLGTFEHEIMHTLGFIHEHSRPDRDKYIKIHFENIKKNESKNFEKYSYDAVDNQNEDYNLASIMHYRNDAFTKNGNDTISALGEPELTFGQRVKFSVGDVHEVNKLYKCEKFLKNPNYKGLYKSYHHGNGRNNSEHAIRNDIKNSHNEYDFSFSTVS